MTTITNSIKIPADHEIRETNFVNNNQQETSGVFGYGFNEELEVSSNQSSYSNKFQETADDIEKNVKNLLGESFFNNLSDDYKKNVLKKYETIKTFSLNNNKKISDTELARRLTNYINALEANAKEQKMGEYVINGGDAFSYNGDSIVDQNIKQQKATGTDEEYFRSILDRGNGTVQLYDTDGDNRVSLNEFIEGEAADWKNLTGEELTQEMRAETEKYFNKMDRDNERGFLNSIELGCHEYARATLGDTNANSNEELTFTEWYLGSTVGTNVEITARYDYASNQIYNVLKNFEE